MIAMKALALSGVLGDVGRWGKDYGPLSVVPINSGHNLVVLLTLL